MSMVTLQSCDEETFEVEVDILKQSIFLRDMFELLGVDDEDEDPLILPNVDAAILKKVIQWCTYHKVRFVLHSYTTKQQAILNIFYSSFSIIATFCQSLLSYNF